MENIFRNFHTALSRLMLNLFSDYSSEAALHVLLGTGPHWDTLMLKGGFDRYDKFFFIPVGASDELIQLWRYRPVEFFTE